MREQIVDRRLLNDAAAIHDHHVMGDFGRSEQAYHKVLALADGRASIEAVAHPTQTNMYYFVADAKADDGSHRFAETLERVCIETVESGKMTKDLALLVGPEQSWMTTEQFFEAIRENLEAEMASWGEPAVA